MNKKSLPSIETLRKLLRYEPKTGLLFWLPRRRDMFNSQRLFKAWNARHAGKEAFTCTSSYGYKKGGVSGSCQLAHRVIWALYYGEWPADQIDHINHDRIDNRIDNLRTVSNRENHMNTPIPSRNTSGIIGVHRSTNRKRWNAEIQDNKTKIKLGSFIKKSDAIDARKAAEIKYGYHVNHGNES